jgi:N-acetylmuramoyl-L-alanine amidase
MARTILSVSALILIAGMGCQEQSAPNAPALSPSPRLDGPTVVAVTPPVSSPRPVSAVPTPPVPKPKPRADIPREWIPAAPVNPWRWIVVHHSATPTGSAAVFDREHRQKGWDELGYHFVIGNGTLTADGQVEVGSRWPKQKWGAHAKTADNRFNDYGIGICLVGNFEIDRPTPAQLRAATKLVTYLMETYHIPPQNVLGHGETKPTDCPGRNLPVAWMRDEAAHRVAELPGPPAPDRTALANELLHDVRSR